jgi:hypothetical protein
MAGAAVVLGEQDVAWTDGEGGAGLRLELQRAGQGDDESQVRVSWNDTFAAGRPGHGGWPTAFSC